MTTLDLDCVVAGYTQRLDLAEIGPDGEPGNWQTGWRNTEVEAVGGEGESEQDSN